MNTTCFTRKIKPLEVVTETQCEEIRQGTMEVLEKTGVVKVLEDSDSIIVRDTPISNLTKKDLLSQD